ncbi:DUF3533 domain-containing protein [Streptomyces sp. LBUM 1476]|nr:DUF3533 domain-containing protein [Streptomyces sp. LBUM 1476]
MTHDNDDATAPTRPGPALWLTPAVLVTVIMAALASLYLGSSVNSADHLDGFPVAVVNADRGDTGAKITEGLRKNTDPHKFDLRTLTLTEAREQMGEGKLYGAIVLPADLTQKLGALSGPGTDVQRPQVTVYTNPLANTSSVSIVNAYATKALTGVNETVGKQLLAAAPKAPASPASSSPPRWTSTAPRTKRSRAAPATASPPSTTPCCSSSPDSPAPSSSPTSSTRSSASSPSNGARSTAWPPTPATAASPRSCSSGRSWAASPSSSAAPTSASRPGSACPSTTRGSSGCSVSS